MKRKAVLLLAAVAVASYLLYWTSGLGTMIGLQRQSKLDAGTWKDDPGNWRRAFGEDPTQDVSVVHSYYWGSDHFTHECIYFFEVKAEPAWREAFIRTRNCVPVASSNACCFDVHYEGTPDWFVPKPVQQYEVWDRPGHHGSLWLNRTNGHFFFYGVQL